MTPTDKMEMQISEENDGGAVVVLPDSIATPPQGDEPTSNEPSGDELDEKFSQNDGLDNDPDREAIRAARREERKLKKQIHREKARESSHLVSSLKQQNQALADRLAALEQKSSGAEMARVDKAIDDAAVQLEYAKMKMKSAVETRDGEGVTKSQEMWFEAQRQLESLQSLKQRASQQNSQQRQTINAPDPVVARMASEWMEENSWYDPKGGNEESQIAQVIDKRLIAEGFDPTSPDYWDELTDRVKKYIPDSPKQGYNGENSRPQRPRSVMTSSGRETAGTTKSNEFRLSPQRVAAMKEAGLWNNTELRQNAIRKYAEWDRSNKQRG
jgi:hypothetical protein